MSYLNTSKFMFIFLIIIAAACLTFQSASAQQLKTKTITLESSDSTFMLKEVGGIVADSNGNLVIQMILESQNRMDEYKKVDLEKGDIIKMANATKVESTKKLAEIYDSLKVGDDFKLGIVRNGKMKIVSLPKGDPEKLPGKMMTMTVGGGGNGKISGGNLQMIVVAGMLITAMGDQLVIADLIEGIVPEFDGTTPTDGDRITKLNGKEVNSGASLNKVFDSISEGDKIEMTFLRDGKEITTSFIKPEEQDFKIMNKTTTGSEKTNQ